MKQPITFNDGFILVEYTNGEAVFFDATGKKINTLNEKTKVFKTEKEANTFINKK